MAITYILVHQTCLAYTAIAKYNNLQVTTILACEKGEYKMNSSMSYVGELFCYTFKRTFFLEAMMKV